MKNVFDFCRFLFWSEVGTSQAIKRADMDGKNVTTLVSSGLNDPYALTIDETTSLVLWFNNGNYKLESCTFTGSYRMAIEEIKNIFIYGMATDGKFGYVGEGSSKSIIEVEMASRNYSVFLANAGVVVDLYLFSRAHQPTGECIATWC